MSVYHQFCRKTSEHYICSVCQDEGIRSAYSVSGGISNFVRHFKQKHPEKLDTDVIEGFTRVLTASGRTVARCHLCKKLMQNTGRKRLLNHRAICEKTQGLGYRQKISEENEHWVDPGTEEWAGFRQSIEPAPDGIYHAQCKNCYETIDALLDDMKTHREQCSGQVGKTKDVEEIFLAEEMDSESPFMEDEDLVVVKAAPKVKRIFNIPKTVAVSVKKEPKVGVTTTTNTKSASKRFCRCEKPPSRFADMARVWERKLEELPLEQALEIEKKMSDMLYEATLTHLQTQKALQSEKAEVQDI